MSKQRYFCGSSYAGTGIVISILLVAQSIAWGQAVIYTTKSPQYVPCFQKKTAALYYDAAIDRPVLSQRIAQEAGIGNAKRSSQVLVMEKVMREKARWTYRIEKYFGERKNSQSAADNQSANLKKCPAPLKIPLKSIDVKGFKDCLTRQGTVG